MTTLVLNDTQKALIRALLTQIKKEHEHSQDATSKDIVQNIEGY